MQCVIRATRQLHVFLRQSRHARPSSSFPFVWLASRWEKAIDCWGKSFDLFSIEPPLLRCALVEFWFSKSNLGATTKKAAQFILT
jgi:hypothetical protein